LPIKGFPFYPCNNFFHKNFKIAVAGVVFIKRIVNSITLVFCFFFFFAKKEKEIGQQSTSIGLTNTLVSAKPPCVF